MCRESPKVPKLIPDSCDKCEYWRQKKTFFNRYGGQCSFYNTQTYFGSECLGANPIIKEEAERRHAIEPVQAVSDRRATHSSNAERRVPIRVRWKCLVLSVVFLAIALCTGYLAYSTNSKKHRSLLASYGGRGWAPTDEELVAWGERMGISEQRARELVPSYEPSPLLSLLSHKAEVAEARKRLEAKHRKVAAFALCSIATGVLGVGFLLAGLRSRGDPSGSPIENAENDRPSAQI